MTYIHLTGDERYHIYEHNVEIGWKGPETAAHAMEAVAGYSNLTISCCGPRSWSGRLEMQQDLEGHEEGLCLAV